MGGGGGRALEEDSQRPAFGGSAPYEVRSVRELYSQLCAGKGHTSRGDEALARALSVGDGRGGRGVGGGGGREALPSHATSRQGGGDVAKKGEWSRARKTQRRSQRM